MNRRPILCGCIDQLARMKIKQRAASPADVTRISMSQDEASKPIHAFATKILPDDAVVITKRSRVAEPIAFHRADVHRGAGFQIECIDFDPYSVWPAPVLDVEMSSWDLREQMDSSKNNLRQKPVCVVEDNRQPG